MGQLAWQKPKVFTEQDIRMFFIPRSRVEIQSTPDRCNVKKTVDAFAEGGEEDGAARITSQNIQEVSKYEEEKTKKTTVEGDEERREITSKTIEDKTPPRDNILKLKDEDGKKYDDVINIAGNKAAIIRSGIKRRLDADEKEDYRTPEKKRRQIPREDEVENVRKTPMLLSSCKKILKSVKRGRQTEEEDGLEDTPSKKTRIEEGKKVAKELFDDKLEWCLHCAKLPCLCILKKVEMKINTLREDAEKKKTSARKEDGRLHQNNIRTPEVVPRPKIKNLSRKKVSLMKEDEVREMKKTTRDIRKMFQDRIHMEGPKTTPTAATTSTT